MIDAFATIKGDPVIIADKIKIYQKPLREIAEYGDLRYYNMVQTICGTPTDFMLFIEDTLGFDFTTFPEFYLFAILSKMFTVEDTAILFGDELDFTKLVVAGESEQEKMWLADQETGEVVITYPTFRLLTDAVRELHGFTKNVDMPGNEHMKEYMLEKERRRAKRRTKKKQESVLYPLVATMVNLPGFKYDYHTVWDITLFQLNESVRRIGKDKAYTNLMSGVYAGTIDSKKIDQKELSWIEI